AEARTTARRLTGGHLRLVRDDVGIRANVGVPETGFVAEALDHSQRVRHRIVLSDPVACIGPRQHYFAPRRPSTPAASALSSAALCRRGLLCQGPSGAAQYA